jgi:transcriptional regulator with XRE-family HTH domain
MNEVQQLLGQLKANGWTLAAIADEVGVHYNTVQKWSAGDRTPTNARAVLRELERLTRRKRIPKRKRYPGKRNPLGS